MVHSITCEGQIETVKKLLALFSSKNTGLRVYIRVEGKYESKKCIKKIKFAFAIYAVKAEVIVGCFFYFYSFLFIASFYMATQFFYHSVLQ